MKGPEPALRHVERIAARLSDRRSAIFFDYDGTLTPIVRHPDEAILTDAMRSLLRDLASRATVAIVSGRDLSNVRRMVDLDQLYYAGSHGFDVAGPRGVRMQHEQARKHLPELDRAERQLQQLLREIAGAWVERKRFAIAVHFREAEEREVGQIARVVDKVLAGHSQLRKKEGKKIFELQPDVACHKGYAVRWLLDHLDLAGSDVLPVYIGDDVTDEDAFRALHGIGLSVRVGSPEEPTAADYVLRDTAELERFVRELLRRFPGHPPRERCEFAMQARDGSRAEPTGETVPGAR